MTYYILCTITYIISYHVPISCLLSCSGYTLMLYYSFLTYCFIIYFLLRSCTVILYFPIFSSCTFHILYFLMIFRYCAFHILYCHIICRIYFVSLTLYFLYLYISHILFSFIYCTCSYTFHVLYFVLSILKDPDPD